MKSPFSPFRPLAGSAGAMLPAILVALALCGCEKHREEATPLVRPVRTVVVEKGEVTDATAVTGAIRARDEVNLAFRIPGKVIERKLEVGDEVRAGQTVALIDNKVEQSNRDAAQAELRSAQATLDEAEANEKRKSGLLASHAVSQYDYDLALRQLKISQGQVEAAQARLTAAEEQLSYTEVKSDATGVVTATGAKTGEVVQAGQMIIRVAQQGKRDAVFDMPAWIIRDGLSLNQEIEVSLADQSTISTVGGIREISPQADPVTRNYEVKVELPSIPAGMFLGATVVGRVKREAIMLVEVPSTALMALNDKPAVWVMDEAARCVRRREVVIDRYTPQSVLVRDGLQPGERVVTAGVQELHEGQVVKELEGRS